MADQALRLNYEFIPTPSPIRASVAGMNPNVIGLQVMVSNPSLNPVPMQSITIEIPVGEDSQRALSTNPNLPGPSYNTSAPWTIKSSASVVTLKPTGAQVVDYVIFTLTGIVVNDTPGVVPIKITERNPPEAKVTNEAYSLVKQEADFPVTNFYASARTIYDLEQSVTLHWECSEQGKQYAYNVHSDSWQPQDCLNGGHCYTCADGVRGVETPPLDRTTNFALDVIQTEKEGHRSIHKTLYTKVRVEVPSISGVSNLKPSCLERVVNLHWRAYNASKCTVELSDGRVLDDNAPVNTYTHGYPVVLPAEPGKYQLIVTAHAREGAARFPHTFREVTVKKPPPTTIPVAGKPPQDMAVTPDGKLALVSDGVAGQVTVLDIAKRQAESKPISYATHTGKDVIAITPDGKLALIFGFYGVTVIDIAERRFKGTHLDLITGGFVKGAAITPDGRFALAVSSDDLSIIDIAGFKLEGTLNIGRGVEAIAITPDGQFALAVGAFAKDPYVDEVVVIDLAKRQVESNRIHVNVGLPRRIAITPDGKFALVTGVTGGVAVIDIAKRQVESKAINLGSYPLTDIAITRDGQLALVAIEKQNAVAVINIPARSAAKDIIPVAPEPARIVVKRDDLTLVLSRVLGSDKGGQVTVL